MRETKEGARVTQVYLPRVVKDKIMLPQMKRKELKMFDNAIEILKMTFTEPAEIKLEITRRIHSGREEI